MRVKMTADDLVGLSDEGLAIRLAGVEDAGDNRACRLIRDEQELRRMRAANERARSPEPLPVGTVRQRIVPTDLYDSTDDELAETRREAYTAGDFESVRIVDLELQYREMLGDERKRQDQHLAEVAMLRGEPPSRRATDHQGGR